MKFTIEEEDEDHSVPFLDTRLIRRDNNTIITSWYTKPGASGRFLHYQSYHQQRQKINLVLGMKNRVIQTSHTSLRTQNLKKLFTLFINSGYPSKLLHKLIFGRTALNNITDNENNTPNNVTIKYFSLPYIENLAFKFKRIFSNYDNVKLAYRNKLTIGNLFSKLKDKDNLLDMSDVVYCIPCGQCEKEYIGQTGRRLKDRITSHKSDIRNNKQSCTLAIHATGHNHNIAYENVRILDRERNTHKRNFLEMTNIFSSHNTLNSKKDIEGLSIIYTYLLHLHQQGRPQHNNDWYDGSIDVG